MTLQDAARALLAAWDAPAITGDLLFRLIPPMRALRAALAAEETRLPVLHAATIERCAEVAEQLGREQSIPYATEGRESAFWQVAAADEIAHRLRALAPAQPPQAAPEERGGVGGRK